MYLDTFGAFLGKRELPRYQTDQCYMQAMVRAALEYAVFWASKHGTRVERRMSERRRTLIRRAVSSTVDSLSRGSPNPANICMHRARVVALRQTLTKLKRSIRGCNAGTHHSLRRLLVLCECVFHCPPHPTDTTPLQGALVGFCVRMGWAGRCRAHDGRVCTSERLHWAAQLRQCALHWDGCCRQRRSERL